MENDVTEYFNARELTKELDQNDNEAMIIMEDVPEGARVLARFESDVPVDLSIRTVNNRRKLNDSVRRSSLFPERPIGFDAEDWKDEGMVVLHEQAKTWSQEYKTDEPGDVQTVAVLPRGTSRAKVTIKVKRTRAP